VRRALWRWLLGAAMGANQFLNALAGGDPDMAMSARAGYARERGSRTGRIACRALDVLDFRNADHCAAAVEHHEERVREHERRRRESDAERQGQAHDPR